MIWRIPETLPETGEFLVYLEAEHIGSRYAICKCTPGGRIVGGYFHYDAPAIQYWTTVPAQPDETNTTVGVPA